MTLKQDYMTLTQLSPFFIGRTHEKLKISDAHWQDIPNHNYGRCIISLGTDKVGSGAVHFSGLQVPKERRHGP